MKYVVPFIVALAGAMLFGPLGLIAGIVIWYLVNKKN